MSPAPASFLVLFLEPIRRYLEDDDVSEIMVNGPGKVYIERCGKLQATDAVFASERFLVVLRVLVYKWLFCRPSSRAGAAFHQ